MGLFESVAGTFFNTATAAYQSVARPVVSAASTVYQTATRPITSGTVSTGQTQQVAIQPKPPIVTAVAPSQPVATAYQQASGSQGRPVTVTPQTTPSGQSVYVTSAASQVMPQPVIISRPVQIQAPSAAQAIGMLAPGAGIVGTAKLISGDQDIFQNIALDVTGLRQQQIQSQQAALQQRSTQLQAQATALQQKSQLQRAQLEQQTLGFEQKKQDILARKQRFEALGPATSIEQYNTRLGEYNLLTSDIQALNLEAGRINAESVAANRAAMREQIGILNTRDQLRAEGVNVQVEAANIGTTGLGGLTTTFEEKFNKPISEFALTEFGKPFGASKEDVALGLRLNRMVSESVYTAAPSIQSAGMAFGAGQLEQTLIKPGEAILWAGVGLATGGVARAIGPSIGPAITAARAPGASLGARAVGFGVRAAPWLMGAAFAGQVGMETAFETTPTGMKVRTPGGMVSRLGGLTATEILPMVGGAYVGYKAPEIGRSLVKFSGSAGERMVGVGSRIKAGEIGQVYRQVREIPFTSAGEFEVGISPKGRGETLLTQKQLQKVRSMASKGEEKVIAFDITTGKEIKLNKVVSSGRRVQWEYPEGIDPTHEVVSIHTHPKEITFSRGDMRKFGFDTRVNEVAKGVVTPSGKVHIIEKPLKGGYKSDIFVQKWMQEYKPNFFRDIVQPKGRRIKTFARTAAEMEMPFRIIEPEQNVVLKATRIGKAQTVKAQKAAIGIESEPRLFDIEQQLKINWAETGGQARTVKQGGKFVRSPRSELSIEQQLGIQERMYRGKPSEYTPRQRGRFPGTQWTDERGFWSYEGFPEERFFDIQTKAVKRGGRPIGAGGVTTAPTTPLEQMGIDARWEVSEDVATRALARFNQPEPYGWAAQRSKWNKPTKFIGREMKVGVSPETRVRIQKSQDIAQLYQKGWRVISLDQPTGLEFEPLGEGVQRALVPGGKKFTKPAPSPGGSESLIKIFKNVETDLNPLGSRAGEKFTGTPELMMESGIMGKPRKTWAESKAFQAYEAENLDIPVQKITGTKGIYTGREALPSAYAKLPVRWRRVTDVEDTSLTGPLSLKQFGIPQITRDQRDLGISLGFAPMIASAAKSLSVGRQLGTGAGSVRIPSVDSITGLNLGQNIRPEITTLPAIGQLPTSLVGTIIEPRVDVTPTTMSIVEPAQIPAITQVPITTTIQVPDLRMDQQLINQQLLITEMNVPPYTPPTYDFIIPEIPIVPIIPGFPMGGGGGGGGGGFGLGQGGYLFEETWAAGGNQDPFGIAGMNFDAASLVGIGSGKRLKRKRRR